MCTVSWLHFSDGYLLICNRDERRTRKPASGPQQRSLRGVSFIAPIDGDHGGSWIGVNEFGLTLCLLNRYGDERARVNSSYISRGLLLTDLLDSAGGQRVEERVMNLNLNQFQPFSLAVSSLEEP